MAPDADVIIIGAGVAGLTTARALTRAGASVLVLEARDRVGGRTLSQPVGGDVVDLGGQWVGPHQRHILRLADELGLKRFPQFHHGTKVLDIRGERRTYRGKVPSLPLLSLLDLQRSVWKLDRLARQVPLEAPHAAPKAAEWDALSLEEWKQRHIPTWGAQAALDVATRAIFGAEPRELSFLHFLFYVHSNGGLMPLAEIENGAQAERLEGGAQGISRRMAEPLGARVVLSAPVRAVHQDANGVTVHGEGRSWTARYAVVAVPPALAERMDFGAELPATRRRAHTELPMGSVIKMVATYARPFWREAGYSGEAVSDVGPIRLCFDDSGPGGHHPALVGFFLGDTAKAWTQKRAEERQRAALECLARFFGPEALAPTAYADLDWIAEPWSTGCYVGLPRLGTLTAIGDALRAPCGRVHWAGTETAREGCGYIDGAVESGERAATELSARR
ncbi:flavin monoamine oxidase family protein [Hyalangium rubrum]|uniref:Flavin monoamine oxidase family protein n=1 Tax=Hyalangium rubrum TaxID=3103134 RepID=A0ABU5HGC2_9BACT|nr:flavin monoamine oxidase family protein [Hyalangium sp. s54d21]MDY7232207.1 flavin monoamine oxidase family protein [Hyalangium sp. s54d21]